MPYGRAVKVVCQVDQRGVIYRLLCLHNASNEFIFYAYRFIKYFDTKLDRVKIHNSSVYFCTWGPVERVLWSRFGSQVTD